MTTPVWCKGCGTSLADKWEAWSAMRPENDHSHINSEGRTSSEVLGALGVKHKHCRTMMVGTNDLLPLLNGFERPKIHARE